MQGRFSLQSLKRNRFFQRNETETEQKTPQRTSFLHSSPFLLVVLSSLYFGVLL